MVQLPEKKCLGMFTRFDTIHERDRHRTTANGRAYPA